MKNLAFALALIVLSSSNIFAQKQNNTDLYVKVKDYKNPLIIVDGKKFDFPMDLIDQSKIKSVFVLKGEEAKALYNTSEGVILITTKDNDIISLSKAKEKSKNLEKPIIIIDGKTSNEAILNTLKPEQIEKMNVLKGKMALEKYNSPSGAIIITTKKE